MSVPGKGRGETMNSQLTTHQPTFTQSVHDIIVELTNNGRTIVAFLVQVMEGELPGFKECHRIEAARLLEKYSGAEAKALIDDLDLPQPTRRERRDSRRADRRIHTELAQIVKEETDNGRTIVTFLIQAMEGQLPDFKPCHRMSASRELLHQGSQYETATAVRPEPRPELAEGPVEGHEPQPEPDPQEQERQRQQEAAIRQQEAARIQREEDIEYSRHGPVYYEIYSYPCTCEDRVHDCEGNEVSTEQLRRAATIPPGRSWYIGWGDTLEAFKARYREYLTRRNARFPDNPIHFDRIHWKDP